MNCIETIGPQFQLNQQLNLNLNLKWLLCVWFYSLILLLLFYSPADKCWLCIKIARWIPALAQANAAIICVDWLWPWRWWWCWRYWIATRWIRLNGTVRLMDLFGSALMQRTNATAVPSRMHFGRCWSLCRTNHWLSQLPIIVCWTIHSDGWIWMSRTLGRY